MLYKYNYEVNLLLPYGIILGVFVISGFEKAVTKILTFVKGFE